MSDSGSESSSSEGYNGRRGTATTPDASPTGFPSRASNSDVKSPMSVDSWPDKSPRSPRASPPASPPASPRSSGPRSPKSPSEPGSPRSRESWQKSASESSHKSYRSVVNSLDSPGSDRSSPESPVRDAGSYRSGPSSPKSTTDEVGKPTTPKSYNSGRNSPASPDRSPKSCSMNSVSRNGSPKSPGSGRSTPKSGISGRSSTKSDRNSLKDDKNRERTTGKKSATTKQEDPASPASPSATQPQKSSSRSPKGKGNSFNELDGEQISDGDIDDELAEAVSRSKAVPMTHGEDLSDVSDLDSLDGVDEPMETTRERSPEEDRVKNSQETVEAVVKVEKEVEKIVPVCIVEETEQLDFEAEGQWKDEREDGETEVPPPPKETKDKEGSEKEKEKEEAKVKESGEINEDDEGGKEDGEKVESELEEGELSDGEDARPEETEPRPVCRFYNRGQCTWGVSCRFLHPGVTDKGNYTMFDMVRPMAYPPHPSGQHEFRPHIERPAMVRPLAGYPSHPHPPKVEELPAESAWERGLRHAKEMMRKANKRKESDMDFEEKKMNLSLGQDELEREAGYYVRAPSPQEPPVERWPPREVQRRPPPLRVTPERYVEDPEVYYPPAAPPEYYGGRERRVQYKPEPRPGPDYRERLDYHPVQRGAPHSISPPPHPRERERERERDREREYYDKYEKKHKRPSREVIVERIPPTKPWREEEPPPVERGRGDEWADPWMRHKSPTAVRRNPTATRRSRRQSYSSGSSYSTTSSSRSSSRSSYTSYDSLSRSRSPTPSSRPRATTKGKQPSSPPLPPPTNTTIVAPSTQRGAMLMNPPAPTPRPPKGSISPTTGTLHRRAGLNPPAPNPIISHQRHHEKSRDKAAIAAAAVAKVIKSRSRSRSSHSSSGSESSGSSSDSSESSYSSSSVEVRRRKGSSPPLSRKDAKGIDALKLSGTKQQIKLTLKSSSSNAQPLKKIDRSGMIAGKKRPLESPPLSESKASVAAAAAKAAKKASSRREELLKQLKAVEDAIARKRSKV